MSMRRSTLAAILLLSGLSVAQDEGHPGLGEPVSAEELAAIDYVVLPNGDGLPPGSGTALEGKAVYDAHCLACHGDGGTGGINDVLAGGHGSLTGDRPQKTVGSFWPYATTVFDYVRRAMPFQTPGSLSDDETYAVTAYILYLNDIVSEDAEINAATLPGVRMPNRNNFVWGYTPE